jgi:hypothetical protein
MLVENQGINNCYCANLLNLTGEKPEDPLTYEKKASP